MRVADKMNFDQAVRTMNDNRGSIATLQQQAASGKKLLKPSDDPISAARVLSARTNMTNSEQYIKNNQAAQNFLLFTDQAMDELTNIFIRAKELAISQANDPSSSPQSKQMVAKEVSQLLDQAISIGNRRLDDRFIFGGFRTMKQPFDSDGNYDGDNGDIQMEVTKGHYMAMNMPGSRVFLGRDYQVEPYKGEKALDASPAETFEQKVNPENGPVLRGPSSINNEGEVDIERQKYKFAQGANILQVLNNLKISLESGDETGVQQAIEELDIAREQVVTIRAQVGSRLSAIDTNLQSLEKLKLDNHVMVSQYEDADAFKVFSDLTQAEGNLQASLQTSGKLIQPSLLDFLR
ncbi:MAG: flagellar hook-associated protein FlgL [Bdellovibrionales bacterium]|nr:flagellar hook-associated protein FlgL [Bdellovibrionales bacterium]